MISLHDALTISDALAQAAERWSERPFIGAPANPALPRHADGFEITYRDAHTAIASLAHQYRAAGYGNGHRVALLLENKPEHILHKLALTSLGVCCVPVNPDYRSGELAYLIAHSKIDLAVVLSSRSAQFAAGLAESAHQAPVVTLEDFDRLPSARRPGNGQPVTADSPASILYTSGTTGRPKGCILSHYYELASGHWYANRGELAAMRDGQERLYNVLPLYHVNSAVVSLFAMMLTGGCQIQGERFQPTRWWPEVVASRATIVHYLGRDRAYAAESAVSPLERQH